MNRKLRAKQIKRLEKVLRKLLDAEWTLEELTITDSREDGFSATFTLSFAGSDAEIKGVM
jgi:hypothetical protein